MAWFLIKVKLEGGRFLESDVTVGVPKEAQEETVAAPSAACIGTGTAIDPTVEVLGGKTPIAIEIVKGPTMTSDVIVRMMTDTGKGAVASLPPGKR